MENSAKRIVAALMLALIVICSVFSMPFVTEASVKPIITAKNAATGSITLKMKEKYKLEASSSGAKLTYKSSRPSVVTVSKKGVLKAEKTGKAKITITAKSGTAKSVKKISVKVVKAKKYKQVKSISISVPLVNLTAGQSVKAEAAVMPKKASNKNIKFISSNPDVASVDANGIIRAMKAGTSKITAISCANKKIKAGVTMTVSAPPAVKKTATKTSVSVKPTQTPSPSSSKPTQIPEPTAPASGGLQPKSTRDYTWKEWSQISSMISEAATDEAGLAIAEKYNVGIGSQTQSVQIKIPYGTDGNVYETSVGFRVIGIRHDELVTGGKAGLTFMVTYAMYRDIMNTQENTNVPWSICNGRKLLQEKIQNIFPAELYNKIKPVKKNTYSPGTSVMETTAERMFIPSMVECYGSDFANAKSEQVRTYGDIYKREGTQYEYFAINSVTNENNGNLALRGIKYPTIGEDCIFVGWFTRSANSYYSPGAWLAVPKLTDSSGNRHPSTVNSGEYGSAWFAPCFCL